MGKTSPLKAGRELFRKLVCLGQDWLGCGVRDGGKGRTSLGSCSTEAVGLELICRGLG